CVHQGPGDSSLAQLGLMDDLVGIVQVENPEFFMGQLPYQGKEDVIGRTAAGNFLELLGTVGPSAPSDLQGRHNAYGLGLPDSLEALQLVYGYFSQGVQIIVRH